jgi:hypothetical protein
MNQTDPHDLLLRCLCEEPDASRLEQLPPSDWHDLIRQARSHAVLYLLYHRLKKRNLDRLIPADMLQTVRTEYFECAWRNNNLYSDLSKVLKALQAEDIPVIVLKGAYLAQAVYQNIALRLMGDIDILVRKNDLLKAKEQLLELGYSPLKETDIATACASSQHLSPMVKQDCPPVELHWSIEAPTRPFTIDLDGLWQRARPATVSGVEALALSPEDLLLHLCLHTSVHHLYSNGLRAFCDIRETIRHYQDELDWGIVQRHAEEWGAVNSVYLTLYLAKKLLSADVPDKKLERLKPDNITPQLIAAAEDLIFIDNNKKNSLDMHFTKAMDSMPVLQKTILFFNRIFLSPNEMAQEYSVPQGSPRIIFYYPVRLKDLILRHTRTVQKILFKDKAVTRQFSLIDWLSR